MSRPVLGPIYPVGVVSDWEAPRSSDDSLSDLTGEGSGVPRERLTTSDRVVGLSLKTHLLQRKRSQDSGTRKGRSQGQVRERTGTPW